MVTREEFEQASQPVPGPIAVSARYDRRISRVVVRLDSGIEIAFSPHDVEGLETARPADLLTIEITPAGRGLHFPSLDADVYVPSLLQGITGSKRWMAARKSARVRRRSVA